MSDEGARPDAGVFKAYMEELQERICRALEGEEPRAAFRKERFPGSRGGETRPAVLEGGAVLERAAVNLSHARGAELPKAATERRPEVAGKPFEAVSISLIVHPRNPYAPTCHANFRYFQAGEAWWFGGGFDLTPYYGFEEDALHWHRTAEQACEPFGAGRYPRFKRWCDDYFFLPHRNEPRGIGGIFFDDLDEAGFAAELAFVKSAADAFLPAYLPILRRRKDTPYGERERRFQLQRRGRYVEFNLVYDRGTRYGLQSGGRIESILASLPPLAAWGYDLQPEAGSPEARLLDEFLTGRDWLREEGRRTPET